MYTYRTCMHAYRTCMHAAADKTEIHQAYTRIRKHPRKGHKRAMVLLLSPLSISVFDLQARKKEDSNVSTRC